MRGGEKVVEALCEMFPEADIYTHVYDRDRISPLINSHRVRTTFIQRLPRATRSYQRYLPLMPMALERLDLRQYDLVICSESGPAKGVICRPGTLQICFCHTPMRYVWDMYHDYYGTAGKFTRALMLPLMHYLRIWDVTSANRVDQFVASSSYVASRIMKYYRRSAKVINSPVDVGAFHASPAGEDFYLMVGQLVPYKRTDIAVEAFNRLGKRLVIIGAGQQESELVRAAKGNVRLLGHQPFDVIRDHYARCRAVIFPGVEDFGMVPVEAMASGRPVLAYREGGVLDSVVEGKTGLFFDRQTPEAVIEAVERFERTKDTFRSGEIIRHAQQFDVASFKTRMAKVIEDSLCDRGKGGRVTGSTQPLAAPEAHANGLAGWTS